MAVILEQMTDSGPQLKLHCCGPGSWETQVRVGAWAMSIFRSVQRAWARGLPGSPGDASAQVGWASGLACLLSVVWNLSVHWNLTLKSVRGCPCHYRIMHDSHLIFLPGSSKTFPIYLYLPNMLQIIKIHRNVTIVCRNSWELVIVCTGITFYIQKI